MDGSRQTPWPTRDIPSGGHDAQTDDGIDSEYMRRRVHNYLSETSILNVREPSQITLFHPISQLLLNHLHGENVERTHGHPAGPS